MQKSDVWELTDIDLNPRYVDIVDPATRAGVPSRVFPLNGKFRKSEILIVCKSLIPNIFWMALALHSESADLDEGD